LSSLDAYFGRAKVHPQNVPPYEAFENNTAAENTGLTTSAIAAIERLTTKDSAYRRTAVEPFSNRWLASDPSTVAHVIGVLAALRADIAAGDLRTVQELVHADVFADFLEMGSELHEKGYKDPAAVIAGSVLEEHVRKLAQKNNVDVEQPNGQPKKTDTLNADLVKAGVYNKLEQKNLTAWLGLRNSAAHGKYDEYDAAQVGALIASVREFMLRHSA